MRAGNARAGTVMPAAAVVLLCLSSCDRPATGDYQGYVENEFVHVASAVSGTLEQLAVREGARVSAGDPLFALDPIVQASDIEDLRHRIAAAEARLKEMQMARRSAVLGALEAQLEARRAAEELARLEFERNKKLLAEKVVSEATFDNVRLALDEARERTTEAAMELQLAKEGEREELVDAARQDLDAMKAQLARLEWSLGQTRRAAPADATVQETLFEPGEWVPAGSPVVVLAPPERMRARFFVPESDLARVRKGDPVRVLTSGIDAPVEATITFVSVEAEFTPPVIYSEESKEKLVWMVEAAFADPGAAARLHPGQPITVRLAPRE